MLAISRKTYGEEHPSFATYLNNLAVVYYEQGKYTEVVSLLQRVLHIWEQHWGPEHAFVAIACNNLAEIYTFLGEYADAELLYQRSLRIWSQQKPRNPKEVDPLDGLANLYRVQDRYSEAEPLYLHALRICEQQLGPEHPQTALLLHNLAQFWEAQGNFEEARTYYIRALSIREQALGTDHPKTTETRNHLVALLHMMSLHEEAIQFEAVSSEQTMDEEAQNAWYPQWMSGIFSTVVEIINELYRPAFRKEQSKRVLAPQIVKRYSMMCCPFFVCRGRFTAPAWDSARWKRICPRESHEQRVWAR